MLPRGNLWGAIADLPPRLLPLLIHRSADQPDLR